MILTAIKDAFEDWRRRNSDTEINNNKCLALRYIRNPNHSYSRSFKTRMRLRWRRLRRRLKRWFPFMFKSKKTEATPPMASTGGADGTAIRSMSPTGGDDIEMNPLQHMDSLDVIEDVEYFVDDDEFPDTADAEDVLSEGPFSPPIPRPIEPDVDPATIDLKAIRPKKGPKKPPVWAWRKWKDIRVGDVVCLTNNQPIPADMVVLSTSEPDGLCYIETKNLDGETNLKIRSAIKDTMGLKSPMDFTGFRCYLDAEGANNNLYAFNGSVTILPEDLDTVEGLLREVPPLNATVVSESAINAPETTVQIQQQTEDAGKSLEEKKIKVVPVTINEMLLRGCTLRNTEWIIGIIMFAGDDTKQMLNSGATPSKRSRIEKLMNPQVLVNLVAVFVICAVIAIGHSAYLRNAFSTGIVSPYWVGLSTNTEQESTFVFFAALIMLQNFVPISLYVTTEIVKTTQAYFIYSDRDMYYEEYDTPCVPKTWSIADDLGQIEYIFTDKTGTLTRNVMEFRKCSIGGIMYGGYHTKKDRELPGDNLSANNASIISSEASMAGNLNAFYENPYLTEELTFVDPHFVKDLHEGTEERSNMIKEFFTHLAICHTVLSEYPEDENEFKIRYQAQSPDEAALVTTAKDLGFVFLDRTNDELEANILGAEVKFQILNIVEFTSARKRMSVLFRTPEGTILLYIKGADSTIYERLASGQDDMILKTTEHLNAFASEGLRTLCLAYRLVPEEEYQRWLKEYQVAETKITDREKALDDVADQIERDLTLLGATAIEDRLQDGVPECIARLARGGIKIWMLTGDKMETAINIGFSCNLLNDAMVLVVIKGTDKKSTVEQIEEALKGCFDIDPEVVRGVSERQESRRRADTFRRLAGKKFEEEIKAKSTGKIALIIDGHSLKFALEKDCKPVLVQLATRCKAVICCRVSPLQKAQVVALVKRAMNTMALAIGDGANDVSMIQEANIGVGIQGLEGMQAVLASDYAIAQFSYLNKLLLVHGRWSYFRTAEMTLLMFYKNMVWTTVLFWYQIYCGWSSAILYDYFLILFYNVVYTGLPPILIGVFDQDVMAKTALEVPEVYVHGIKQELYTLKRFSLYMIDGVYQSLVEFFIGYWVAGEDSIYSSGQNTDLKSFGLVSASIAVLHAGLYMGLNTYHWTWLIHFGTWASLIIYFLVFLVATSFVTSMLGDLFIMTSAAFWFSLPLGIVLGLLPRYLLEFAKQMIHPTDVQLLREMQNLGIVSQVARLFDTSHNNSQEDLSAAMVSTPPGKSPIATISRDSSPQVPQSDLPIVQQQPLSVDTSSSKPPLERIQTAPASTSPISAPMELAQRFNQNLDRFIAEPLKKSFQDLPVQLRRATSLLFVKTGTSRPNRGFAFSQEPGLAQHLPQIASPAAMKPRPARKYSIGTDPLRQGHRRTPSADPSRSPLPPYQRQHRSTKSMSHFDFLQPQRGESSVSRRSTQVSPIEMQLPPAHSPLMRSTSPSLLRRHPHSAGASPVIHMSEAAPPQIGLVIPPTPILASPPSPIAERSDESRIGSPRSFSPSKTDEFLTATLASPHSAEAPVSASSQERDQTSPRVESVSPESQQAYSVSSTSQQEEISSPQENVSAKESLKDEAAVSSPAKSDETSSPI